MTRLVFAIVVGAGVLCGAAQGEQAVLAVSVGDGVAVMREGRGGQAVVSIGDEIGQGLYVVRNILPDRVVLEERGGDGTLRAEVWVYLANEEGVSRVERVERTAPPVEPREVTVPVREGAPGVVRIGEGTELGEE